MEKPQDHFSLPTLNSQLPTPNSQLPTPNSQLPTPNSQLPTPNPYPLNSVAQHNPHSIQLQINRLFESGQSLFATTKVEDWLKQRNENPADYKIIFNKQPAAVGSRDVMAIAVELQRRDGEPVDEWLLAQLNDIQ